MNNPKLWSVESKTHRGRKISYICMAETGRAAIRKAKQSKWSHFASSRWIAILFDNISGKEYDMVWFNEAQDLNGDWSVQ